MDVVTKGDPIYIYMDAYSSLWFINNYCLVFAFYNTWRRGSERGKVQVLLRPFLHWIFLSPSSIHIKQIQWNISKDFKTIEYLYIHFFLLHTCRILIRKYHNTYFPILLYPISLKYLSTFQNKLERTNKPIKIVGSVSNTHQ